MRNNNATRRHLLMTVVLVAPLATMAATPVDRSRQVEGDLIVIPVGSQGRNRPAPLMPDRGESQRSVQQRFGDPLHITPAVGNPPISQWRYGEFTVYFEGDRVIHSVLPHQPTAVHPDH
ncbi:MAG TPA: hypothetical protein VIK82_08030 [Porticoccaceae bacterium]